MSHFVSCSPIDTHKEDEIMMIVTDTASDILESEAAELGIRLAPLDIAFGDVHCSRNTPEMLDEFYRLLTTSEEFPKTSQPAPDTWLGLFREAQDAGEDVLVLTMTSEISGTYESACMAARLSGYDDHIAVVDTRQAIICQYIVVRYAAAMRDEGKSLDEIVELVNEFTKRVHVHGILGTLTYLRKGGRIPASAAAIGNLLKIKPTISIDSGELVGPAKAKGTAAAKRIIWKDLETADLDPEWPVYFPYTSDRAAAEKLHAETIDKFGFDARNTRFRQVSGTIGAHLGPGAFGFAYVTKA
ncbi:MAG: DegV family protein [Slackia sp.]|nr:DegV family protein [Slackia sp.]